METIKLGDRELTLADVEILYRALEGFRAAIHRATNDGVLAPANGRTLIQETGPVYSAVNAAMATLEEATK